MAETATPIEDRGRHVPRRADHRWVRTRSAGVAVAALMALTLPGGCGGEQFIDNGAAGPVVTSATTTTAPTTTTTTIDFDRPILQADTPLDAQAEPADIAALVAEIRGQTADVDAQVRRLAPFPDLSGPAVAQILDLAVTLAPEVDETHPSAARVRYRVPDAGATVVVDLDRQLRSLGWFKADETDRPTADGVLVEMVYRVPGRPDDELELLAMVEERPGVTIVDLEYVVVAEEDESTPDEEISYLERLSAWQDALPLPRAASLVEVGIETAPDQGILSARYRLEADDEAEAVTAVIRSIGREGYQLAGNPPAEPPTAGPIELIDTELGVTVVLAFTRSSESGLFEIQATTSFALTPLE